MTPTPEEIMAVLADRLEECGRSDEADIARRWASGCKPFMIEERVQPLGIPFESQVERTAKLNSLLEQLVVFNTAESENPS